jgi:serine/threonine protein kinase
MMPDPDRQRVVELFDAAIRQSPGERYDFLRRACEGDDALMSEVRSLIAESERLGDSREMPLSGDRLDHRKVTSASPAEHPKQIGRYSVVRELGRGAMGVVFEARDPLIGRTVAIKTIRLDALGAASEQQWQERLFREARSAGALSHPGIVTIHDVGVHEEIAFVAMEYIDGPTLESLIGAHHLDHVTVTEILRQAAAALDYANETGVIHRDVKPGNIMLHKGRAVKIADFGIAKITATQQLTRTGTVMGTPSYMSPEQIRAMPVDGRSDQFSLAVVAFELVTGVKPFRADSLATLVHQIVYEDRPSARTVNDELCEAVDNVFFRALAKAPEERFANCAQMVEELSEALKKSAIELEERQRREEQKGKSDRGVRTSSVWKAAESHLNILAGEFEGKPHLAVLRSSPPMASSQALTGSPRMQAILWIGVAVTIAYGVLWALAERLFGWNFGGDFDTRFNQACGVSSLLGLVLSLMRLFRSVGDYLPTWSSLTRTERLNTFFQLSILILIAHALTWWGIEKVFGWDYATGETPKGIRAAVMSLSLTLPAVIVPFFYQYATSKTILSKFHSRASILAVSGGMIGYILLFGLGQNAFSGVRDTILSLFRYREQPLWAEILATLAYALILVVFIALPYRLLVLPDSPVLGTIGWSILASLVTFFGLSAYILLKYPASLDTNSHWGFLRGIIAGIFTVVSVCMALYA